MTATKDNVNLNPQYKVIVTRKAQVIDRIKLCFIVGVIYILFHFLQIGCPLKFVTGISCPGCGMSRAVWYALHLDFSTAFYYHPLFAIAPILALFFIFEPYINVKLVKISWGLFIAIFLTTYIIRLLTAQNDVVEIDIWSGVVLRLLHQ